MAVARAVPARTKSSRTRAGEIPVVDVREAVRVSKAEAKSAPLTGFGCPPLSDWPHHIKVSIPSGRGGRRHCFGRDHGILGDAHGPEEVERCVVPRGRWERNGRRCEVRSEPAASREEPADRPLAVRCEPGLIAFSAPSC